MDKERTQRDFGRQKCTKKYDLLVIIPLRPHIQCNIHIMYVHVWYMVELLCSPECDHPTDPNVRVREHSCFAATWNNSSPVVIDKNLTLSLRACSDRRSSSGIRIFHADPITRNVRRIRINSPPPLE